MNRLHLSIGGMGCGACIRNVAGLLSGIEGVSVEKVEVGRATVLLDPARTSVDDVTKTVEEGGYPVRDARATNA